MEFDPFNWTVIASTAICLFILWRYLYQPFPRRFTAKVVWVCDGDTIYVRRFLGRKRKIRLIGMDAPESEQEFGQESESFLRGVVHGKTVQIESIGKDHYGRWVSRVYLEGQDISLLMIAVGLAWPYYSYFLNLTPQERKAYRAAGEQAKRQRVGLWSQSRPEEPWRWRRRHRTLWQRFILWLKRLLKVY